MDKPDDARAPEAFPEDPRSARLAALAAARNEADATLLRATTETGVYEGLCGVLVRRTGLPLVWIGLVEPGTHRISVQAAAGSAIAVLDETGFRQGGMPLAGGTIGRAMQTGVPQTKFDGERESPVHATARAHGIRSHAAFPMRTGHMVVGVLHCSAHEADYFGAEEVALIGQLTVLAASRVIATEIDVRRRDAERDLTTSQQRYRGLFEMAPVPIMVASRGHLEVNRALLEMFGYEDQAALESAGVMSLIDPSDVQAIEEMRASIGPEAAAPHILQTIGRRADGSTFPMLVEGAQIELDGARSGLVFLTDLTTLEAAEAASRQSRSHLRALIDGSPLAIVSVDLEGIVRSWNVAAEQIFGWTGAEVVGRRRSTVPAQLSKLSKLAAGSLPPMRGHEVSVRHKDGTAVDLRVSSAPLLDRDGEPSGSMLVMENITDLNRLEAERARLATAIDQASESIVITDPAASIVYVNPAFERLTGYRRDEAVGKNPRILKSGEQSADFYAEMWSTLTGGRTWHGFISNRRKDGTRFEEEATISPVRDSDGKLINYIAVKRDVTRERELERERDASEALFRRLFVEMQSGMAVHEIICDEHGSPVDYRFLDANPAFETYTGLRGADIVGKTAHEILPDLEREWIERYGRVALTGEPDEFERYNASLDRYYQVRAYSPAPGQFAVMFNDVTERRRSEDAIRAQARFTQQLIDAMPTPISAKGTDGRILLANAAFVARTGRPVSEVVGSTVAELGIPEWEKHRDHDAAVLEGGPAQSYEGMTTFPGGPETREIVTKAPVVAPDGSITGIVTSAVDITAHYRAEQEVLRAAEEFRTVFDSAGDGLWIVESDGAMVEVNSVICERLGYSRDELLGMSVPQVTSPELAGVARDRIALVMAQGSLTFETVHVHRDGTEVPTEVVARRIEFRGRPAILSVLRDISERRRSEEALRHSEARYRAIVQQTPVAVGISRRGLTLEVNDRYRELFRLPPDEDMTGRPLAELIAPERRAEIEDFSHRRARGEPVPTEYETTGLRADGSRFPMHVAIVRIELADGPAALGLMTDMSDQRRAEQEREESQAQLRAVLDSTSDLIWSVDPVDFSLLTFNRGLSDYFMRERGIQIRIGSRQEELFDAGDEHLGLWRGLYERALREGDFTTDYAVSSGSRVLSVSLNVIRRDDTIFGISVFGKDITERKRADEALLLSEQRFRNLFDSGSDAILIRDMTGHFIEVNRTACERLGYSREELLTMTVADINTPESASTLPAVTEAIGAQGSIAFEATHLRRDGSILPVEISSTIIEFEGRPAVMSFARDITERKAAEQELRRSRALMRSIVDSSPDAIYVKDPQGRYLLFNTAAERFVGKTAAEVLGRDDTLLFPADEAASVMDRDRQAMLADAPTTWDESVTTAGGSVSKFLSTKGPIRAEDGSLVGLFGIARDITERDRIQSALAQSELKYSAAFRTSPDAVNINRVSDGLYLDMSDGFAAMTGYTRDEVLGKSSVELSIWAEPEARARLVSAMLSDGFITNMEMRFRRKDGSVGTGLMSARLIEVDGEPCTLSITRDITERKAAEQRFRDLFDLANDAIFIRDYSGRFLEVNRTACERLGYSRDELLAMSVADIDTPEFASRFDARTESIIGHGSDFFETAHVRRDGTVIPVEINSTVVEFDGHRAIMSVARDITERQVAAAERTRLQAELQERTAFAESIVASAGEGIVVFDREMRFRTFNPVMEEMTGVSADQVLGKSPAEVFPSLMESGIGAAFELALAGETVDVPAIEFVVPSTGVRRWMLGVSRPLRNSGAEIVGVVSSVRDITARHKAEASLRLSEQRFKSLFDNAGDAVLISDEQGHLLDANRTACERLGYTREELLTMKASDIDTPTFAAGFADRAARLLERGIVTFESEHLARDGSVIPSEITATVIELDGKRAFLALAHDLTERKQAEAEKAALEDQLRQAQKMEGIGRLAGGIAHDFNNLLTAIRGNASLALTELPPDSRAREDLEQIEQASDRAAALTRQLLAFARRTVLQPEVVDLGAVVRRLQPMLGRLIGEDVALIIEVPESCGSVLADPGQIEQVVVNLAVNARDAMPDGGTLTITVSNVEAEAGGAADGPPARKAMTSMSVTDTGVGMNPDTLSHLFEPFFTTKGPGQGTGLGLATVYGIVRQSGGTVAATSQPGQGSTLTILLPRVSEAPVESPRPPSAMPAAAGRTGTILIVEDDGGVREFAARVLKRAGYRILTASDGPAAIAGAGKEHLQLLLTDVVMPNMSGHEVAVRLAQTQPGLRVLYMSGHTDKGIVRDGVLEPGIDFLSKPFTGEALLHAVAVAMEQPEG
jgi:two-component system, cell cycle sensor histidine kinase and response regulator CckA